MELSEAEPLCRELIAEHLGDRWSFRWDRAVRRFGLCRWDERIISLSRVLVELNDEDAVRDTVLHEIAHALAPRHAGHGRTWQRIATAIGAKPERSLDAAAIRAFRATVSRALPFVRMGDRRPPPSPGRLSTVLRGAQPRSLLGPVRACLGADPANRAGPGRGRVAVVSAAAEGPVADGLLALAVDTAEAAGALILGYTAERADRAALRDGAQSKSSATDLVTRADRASEELIVSRLLAARPGDGVVAEEGSRRRGTSGLEWVIDPIDGTTNFVYGYPGFAVSIAASDAQGALIGVVHDPLRRETFTAIRGTGSFCDGERITPRATVPPLAEALLATGFGYGSERRSRQAGILSRVLPEVRDVRRGGNAALDLCSVALGRVDVYYEAGLGRWDREAGVLIATEAGCVASDLAGILADIETLVVAPPPLFGPLVALLERAAAAG